MITIFQHGAGEPPGFLMDILDGECTVVPVYEGGEVPLKNPGELLIFLGGLMSVNDDAIYPWLPKEKRLIRQALKNTTPVLGICLGAQLIASALGEDVVPCHNERGWVTITRKGNVGIDGLGSTLSVFQWHGECFTLPEGSSLLYSGSDVKNQMFSYGTALGTQFHPEVTEEIIENWTHELPLHIRDSIGKETRQNIEESHAVCRAIVRALLKEGS
jgi:GMP synthase (glutamine-hydrolysing)